MFNNNKVELLEIKVKFLTNVVSLLREELNVDIMEEYDLILDRYVYKLRKRSEG